MDSLPFIDPQQRQELGEALLRISRMIAASRTQPVEVATMCLHCRELPATKVEGPDGFTLCDACYFQALPEVPHRSAQDRMIAVQTAEILRLTRELAEARNALCGGG